MIDVVSSWLTGNPVIDAMAIAGTVFLLLIFGGLPLWAFLDRFRASHGEHWRPVGEVAPAVAEVERKSPFARKRVAK
jgi:hypothetical protein